MDELINHRNIINYVKAQRLSWFGHINRMPETNIIRKIYKWKPSTIRPVERPKSRWEDDVRIALNGRILSGKPRLYQSCSAEEEEEEAGCEWQA